MEPSARLPRRGSSALGFAVAALLASWALAIGLFLFPFDSDGAFAVHDGIWMGMGAERADPVSSISPHHPLFHAAAIALAQPLRALGVEHPGHAAIRLIAGLGAAWLLIQIARLAGEGRPLAGLVCALPLACSRGFVVECAAGENVLPAAAAALFALTVATARAPRLVAAAAATTLALLVRQDNVFIVPGVLLAVAAASPPGRRLRAAAAVALLAGAATLGLYAAGWLAADRGQTPFHEWLLLFGRKSWSGPAQLELSRFPTYFHSITLAMTGQLEQPPPDSGSFAGLLWIPALLLPGILLRGSQPRVALFVPVALTLLCRAPFHTWFEATNFEWLVLPLAFVAACAGALANGSPATALPWRIAGALAAAGLAAWLLVAHGPSTLRLRERRLMSAIETAADFDRRQWSFIAWGGRAGTALTLLRVPHRVIYDDADLPAVLAGIQASRDRRATIVLGDRFAMDGMPWQLKPDAMRLAIDGIADTPEARFLRSDGRVFGVKLARARAETRTESR